MPINYTSAGYQISPQFANLGALQGLQPLDVTRKANVEYRPLTQMQVYSSQPELATQGIAQGIQAAVGGISGAVTAHYAAKAETAKEERKYAHEIALEQSKKGEKTLEKQDQREWELRKMKEQDKLIRERKKGVLPGGFFGSEDDTTVLDGDTSASDYSGDLPEIDPDTGENVNQSQVDLSAPVDEVQIPSDQKTTQPVLSKVSPDIQKTISENVARSVKYLSELDPSQLSASTGAGPIAQIPEEKPSMSLQGIDTSFISPEKGKEIAQTRIGLREAIKEPKKAAPEGLQPGIYPVISKSQSDELLRKPLAENVKSASLIRNPQTGQYAYVVEQMTPAEISEKQMREEESKSKISSRKQYKDQKQERLYQQYITAAQNEPSVKSLEDPKFGMSKFTAEIPEFYQQYKDYLYQAQVARQKGDKKGELYNRRMVAETVNAIIDSFTRLASGKAVTVGQLNMIKKESIDPLQGFQKNIDSWLKGGVVSPDEQVRSITKIATSMGNEASEKANYFILGQREKFKEQGVPEKNLPKFYPQDIGFENEAKKTLSSLTDDYQLKSDQYDEIKNSKDEKDQYKIDILKKQLQLIDYRIDSLKERITGNELMAKKGKRKEVLGHKEFVDRPTGLRDMYGISPFQQMIQQIQQPVSE